MKLTETGYIANDCWSAIPEHFQHARIDEFIIMPDHVHGIIIIKWNVRNKNENRSRNCIDADDPRRDAACCVSTTTTTTTGLEMGSKPEHGSLSAIIRSYKSAVTKKCHDCGYTEFAWQKRFHDRIIRDEGELNNVRKYIRENARKSV